jgi:hypothetical protein
MTVRPSSVGHNLRERPAFSCTRSTEHLCGPSGPTSDHRVHPACEEERGSAPLVERPVRDAGRPSLWGVSVEVRAVSLSR